MSKRGLGKGLDALLATPQKAGAPAAKPDSHLPISQLTAGAFQPRRRFDKDELATLADSVRQHGILQPLVVRPVGKSAAGGKTGKTAQYEIIAGERRWRAAQKVGLTSVPVIIRNVSDNDAQIFALIENIQRADLNPVEQADGIRRLVETFKLTHEQAAQKVGLSRPAITNLLRLKALAPAVRDLLQTNQLEMGHARALLTLSHAKQISAARSITARNLTVRETEKMVRQLAGDTRVGGGTRAGGAAGKSVGGKKDTDTINLENELKQKLKMPVVITHSKKAGKITITYGSLDNLDKLIKKLKK